MPALLVSTSSSLSRLDVSVHCALAVEVAVWETVLVDVAKASPAPMEEESSDRGLADEYTAGVNGPLVLVEVMKLATQRSSLYQLRTS